jgi:hypothetical protein
MTRVFGVSAFGLNDCVAEPDGELKTSGFYVADAVLPKRALGQIRTGDEAEKERVHSGLDWPPEARVKPGKPLRRVPIPVAWSLLVDAGDTPVPARWSAQDVSIPLATIIAAHVRGVLHEKSGFDTENDSRAVVAIPDHLDEFHQEALLQAFGGARASISLVWRTVAVAMEWLDKAMPDDLEPGDWMLVAYMGPDGIEFMSFELREEVCGDRRFVLPVRNRPRHLPGPAGWQWACALAGKADPICSTDHGAFWQTFTNFPELWLAIAARPWKTQDLPRAWSTADGWRYWHPPQDLFAESARCSTDGGDLLLDLVKTSSSIPPRKRQSKGETWGQHLAASLALVLRQRRGRLRGAVFCGPLCPAKAQPWLKEANISLAFRQDARPDTLWLANSEVDPVATGARLFGRRLAAGLPTYLDTLPGLALYAEKVGGGLEWMDIVEAKEWAGGHVYMRSIPDRFFLKKQIDALHVYLRKDAQENETESPYRYGEVKFPSIPARDVKLTIEVEMRPASGLARVVIVPEMEETFQGRARAFDYSKMVKVEERDLPEPVLRWPETLHRKVTISEDAFIDHNFKSFIGLSDNFLPSDFLQKLDNMKKALCSSFWNTETNSYEIKIDENGIAGSEYGNTVVKAIATKIESRVDEFLYSQNPSPETRKYVVRATWLWGKTPTAISNYLMQFFVEYQGNSYDANWNHFADAASRCFIKKQHFEALFNSIYKRSKQGIGKRFPINSSRSLSKVLAYREDAYDVLDGDMAGHFAERAAKVMLEQMLLRKIKTSFFQGAFLFLTLLRFRIKEPNFMDPENPRDVSLFKKVENCMEEAREIVRSQFKKRFQDNRLDRIDWLLQGIVDFMYSKGKSGLINAIANEAGGDVNEV